MKESVRQGIPRLVAAVVIALAFFTVEKLHHLQEERALRFPRSNARLFSVPPAGARDSTTAH